MRTLIAVLTLGLGMSILPLLSADETRAERGEGLIDRLQDLQLTADQETKIAEIRRECGLEVTKARKELVDLVQQEVDKIREVLTAEQREKIKELKSERREHRADCLAHRLACLKELDLTNEEMEKIGEIRKEYHAKVASILKQLGTVLTDEQKKAREQGLKEGKRRVEVLRSLKLSDEQKAKVEKIGMELRDVVKEELEKIGELLTTEQKAKLSEMKDERRERVRDRMAHRIAHLKDLNLTEEQVSKIKQIRTEYRPKIQEAGNKLRAAIRDEVQKIREVLKG